MSELEKATFGGGCFWCVEAVFERMRGVEKVVSGYTGGAIVNPTYEQVCSGLSGHAEVVQVHYNPVVIGFGELLDIFWQAHDPTTLNRQGADVGSQYRSVIFYSNEDQRKIAEESIAALSVLKRFKDPIVTEISPLETLYEAEEHHQDYYRNNSDAPYCRAVIHPKLKKLGMTH